jgi:regulator of replication initiation timing
MMPTLSIRKEILKQKEEEVGRLRSENTALSIEVGMLKKKLDETESSFRYDFLLF